MTPPHPLTQAAERRRGETQSVLSDLTRAKAAFQLRAIVAAMDCEHPTPRQERVTKGQDDE